MESEETLRWPTNLDRRAIEQRLVQARATAEKQGWTEIVALLSDVETKSPAEIAKSVMAALEWLQRQPRDGTMLGLLVVLLERMGEHQTAQEAFEAALAAGMAGMAHALDPELFILGGQIAEAGPTLFGPLRKDFYGRTLRLVGRRIPIRKAALGESAGVLGAAASAWKVLESDSLRFLAPSRLRGERSARRIHR